MIQDGSEKDIGSALQRLCINSDGDKPDEDDNGLPAVSDLKAKVLLAIEKLREKKKRPDISTITDFLQKTETCTIDLIEIAINELIKQKTIVIKKTQKGNDSLFRSTKSEVSCDLGTENRKQCLVSDNELTDKQFDETFPQMKCNIEIPITTGKIISNAKTILKLEAKISAIKCYLDCKISALSDKTNTLSASIDLALKAIEEKQEKTIQNLEQNTDFLQKELTTKNEFIIAIMDTQRDLVNTLFNNQEKSSSQNLKHC